MSDNTEIKNNIEVSEASESLSNIISFLRDLVVIFLIAITIRSFVFLPFQIKGSSMDNSYSDREYILVNVFSYLNFDTHFNNYIRSNPDPITGTIAKILKKIPIHIGDPKRGDAIVLRPNVVGENEYFFKRVIGLPGETIRISQGKVFIKAVGADDFVEISEPYLSLVNVGNTKVDESLEEKTYTIPDDTYWVMGDNRVISVDSRGCFSQSRCTISGATHFLPRDAII